MKSLTSNRRRVKPSQSRKGVAASAAARPEDLYTVFAKGEGRAKTLRPWADLSDTEQKRWAAVADSLR